ncbi:Activin_recp domain-containing protein [Caenorhabditis elegans]|uniref:Activin_recp domain-containing protein n=1 Tax=Caenorhabditis elegans TaxID=6239 RepID=B3WFX9_CAEEL|nr:Activin_recp domain-containing protein [Caenorhabditis elegans]CAQ76481.2 Activin_recp domain-containing protein [Caenorhabditis elegans]|eukprot:NP_001352245.1 Uncharacterized protein CELE_F53F8.7 [Caenorhabditis elegans]
MPNGPLLLLTLLLIMVRLTHCLLCLEGSDCVMDASCGECSGVACARIVSHNLDDNREVALTCLPYDTRNFHKKQLEEEGCKVIGDRQTCICYNHDYCNSSSKHFNIYGFPSLSFLCFFLFCFFL